MFSRIRSLMLFGGFSMLTALFSLDAFAITVTLAEVEFEGEDDFAVVMGRKAASNGELYWIDEDAYVYEHVGTASRNGKFSFRSGHVPDDCEGTLSVVVSEIEVSVITVPLDFCSSGGGEPPPPPPPEPAVELTLVAKQLDAHGGTDVRGVGFRVDREGPIRVVSGGEDADLRSWTLDLNELSVQNLNHTIYDLESSYDGSIVLTGEGGWNGGTDTDTFRISDEFGLLIGTRAPIGYVYCVALSRNAQWAVASGFYGDILVYDEIGKQAVTGLVLKYCRAGLLMVKRHQGNTDQEENGKLQKHHHATETETESGIALTFCRQVTLHHHLVSPMRGSGKKGTANDTRPEGHARLDQRQVEIEHPQFVVFPGELQQGVESARNALQDDGERGGIQQPTAARL